MTLPANSKAFSEALPSEDAQRGAKQLLETLAAAKQGDTTLRAFPSDSTDGLTIDLHPTVSDALMGVLRLISQGDAVTLIPINKQLTTQQAADVLNVSRPYLIKLLDKNEIRYVKIGRHRRIEAKDIFEYKSKLSNLRASELDKLAKSDADLL